MPVPIAVRIRPLNESERLKQTKEAVVKSGDKQIHAGHSKSFTFDYVFGPASTQRQMYDDCVKDLIDSGFEGYNVTIMVYGQTGTGKTYTIGQGGMENRANPGVMQFAATQIFDNVAAYSAEYDVKVVVSYIEIYMETVVDLLDTSRVGLHIRESDDGGTALIGVSEVEVTTAEQLMRCMNTGTASRQVNSTRANNRSSRSHAILSVMIEKTLKVVRDEDATVEANRNVGDPPKSTFAQIQFVDLAGSERAKNTGTRGTRLKESIYINSGLLALGNVVSALANKKRRKNHVPYRDSKLTRLLKNSLGGNSKTLMILCVGPSDDALNETLCTLKYGTRARVIKNDPKINYDPLGEEVQRMRAEITRLQSDLHSRNSERSSTAKSLGNVEQDIIELSECIAPALSGLAAMLPHVAMSRLQQILDRHGIQYSVDEFETPSHDLKSNLASTQNMKRPHTAHGQTCVSSWQLTSSFGGRSPFQQKHQPQTDGTPAHELSDKHVGVLSNDPIILSVRLERMEAEISEMQQKLEQAELSLREDEEVFANKNNVIELLTQENSLLRNKVEGTNGVSPDLSKSNRGNHSLNTSSSWQSPFMLGKERKQFTQLSMTSPNNEIADSLTSLMHQLRSRQFGNFEALEEDLVVFGESLDDTLVDSLQGDSNEFRILKSNNNDGGSDDDLQGLSHYQLGEQLSHLIELEVNTRISEVSDASQQSKINELVSQHWELGIHRDSIQLQQLRQSQMGTIANSNQNENEDGLDNHLEQIRDEIASVEATIEYREQGLKEGHTKRTPKKINKLIEEAIGKMTQPELKQALKEQIQSSVEIRVKQDRLCADLEGKAVEIKELHMSVANLEATVHNMACDHADRLQTLRKDNARLLANVSFEETAPSIKIEPPQETLQKAKHTEQDVAHKHELEHEHKPDLITAESQKIADLSKSLYYYKKRSRELRRMLEACTNAGVVVTNPFEPMTSVSPMSDRSPTPNPQDHRVDPIRSAIDVGKSITTIQPLKKRSTHRLDVSRSIAKHTGNS
eukprot:m.266307 g.266307  ORF g.266307 m.266307 type:complete len:1026 (-) comp66532_c0_seq1:173-3250(-)